MRFFQCLCLVVSAAAFGATILPIANPTFNGAITGSAPAGTTVTAQLPESNGVQGIKLYLQDPFTGVPNAGISSTIIGILGASGQVGGTTSILAGTPFTISYDFSLQYDPGIVLSNISMSANIYTPGESSSIAYLSEGHAIPIGNGTQFTGSYNTQFLNTLDPGTFVEISVFLQSNFTATSGQNITLTIPGSSIDIFASAAPQNGVPEPSTASLIAAVGGLMIWTARRRKQ